MKKKRFKIESVTITTFHQLNMKPLWHNAIGEMVKDYLTDWMFANYPEDIQMDSELNCEVEIGNKVTPFDGKRYSRSNVLAEGWIRFSNTNGSFEFVLRNINNKVQIKCKPQGYVRCIV